MSPPRDDEELVIGSVCTGYGGLDLGVLAALGGRVAWVADPDPHVGTILSARMPGVPNLGDITAVDWDLVAAVDVLTAGFPCQDISAAGRRAGIEKGQHSGLWTNVVAGVRALRPALVVVENVAALRWRNGGLHRVLGDLAEAGYDALWRSVRAADIGAAHRRDRVFLLAWPRPVAARRGAAAADAAGDRRDEGRPGAAGLEGRIDAALGGHATDSAGCRAYPVAVPDMGPEPPAALADDWGTYAPAIRRWERVLGRRAPSPTQPGRHGRPVLAPAFVEWLQGLEPGWVTGLGLPRGAELRALGNGVVPQQAAHAVGLLLDDLTALRRSDKVLGVT